MKLTLTGIPGQAGSRLTFMTIMLGSDAIRFFCDVDASGCRARKRDLEYVAATAVWKNATLGPIVARYSGDYKLVEKKRGTSNISLLGKSQCLEIVEGAAAVSMLRIIHSLSEAHLHQISVLVALSFEGEKSDIWSEEYILRLAKHPREVNTIPENSYDLISQHEAFILSGSPYLLGKQHIDALPIEASSHLANFISKLKVARPELAQLMVADKGTVEQRKRDFFSAQPVFVFALFSLFSALEVQVDREHFWEWLRSLDLQRDKGGSPNPLWIEFMNAEDGSLIQTEAMSKQIAAFLNTLFKSFKLDAPLR